MKVGVLTFHNAYNYGAILQAYATQEIVKSYGHEVEVIDYHNKAIDKDYNDRRFNIKTLPKRDFYRIPGYVVEKFFYWKRRNNYKKFIDNYLQLSKSRYYPSNSLLMTDYDIILIGSDQLWNKKLTGGFDQVYWGEFATHSHIKKIAWSICMNETNTTKEENAYIVNHLKNFYAISVREHSLQVFLKKLSQNNYPQTLDPTLMLTKENWEGLCHPVKEVNYIAIYAVQNERETIEYARHIANILKKKIIIIRSYSKPYWTKENKEYASPTDFLSYIRYADFIVTTSFHGTIFSILFQKQFICPIFRDNSRIESLLKLAGLEKRRILPNEDIINIKTIDYNMVRSKMEEARKDTKVFLDSFLS